MTDASSTAAAAPSGGRTFRFACSAEDFPMTEALLRDQGYAFEPEPFSPLAMRLTAEPKPLGSSIANFFGFIYIQDKSSMLPPLMLAPAPGTPVLDMCASPGGKTSLLSLLTGPHGFVLGNEVSRSRLETMRRNLDRMNATNTGTCAFPGQDLPLHEGRWPGILLDPPCSGLGTLDKHPEAKRWQGEKAEPLVRLQRELLTRAAALLAPGGTLLYSTCTTSPAENEEQTAWAIDTLGLALSPMNVPSGFGLRPLAVSGLEGVLPVDGQASDGQGFYLARLTKPGALPAAGPNEPSPAKGTALSRKEREACAEAGCHLEGLPPGEVLRFGESVFFVPAPARAMLGEGFPWQGAPVGRFKKQRFFPNPRLRSTLPPPDDASAIHAQDVGDLERLLAGQPLPAPKGCKHAALYFMERPVCRLVVKGSRALWSDR